MKYSDDSKDFLIFQSELSINEGETQWNMNESIMLQYVALEI